MANVGYPASVLEMSEVRAAAGAVGLQVATLEIRHKEDIAPAFDTLKGRAEALYVCNDPLMATNHSHQHPCARRATADDVRFRDRLGGGGLMSYGPNIADLFRRAGDYVDKILRVPKPADLPVEQPTKFDLVFNLTLRRR